MQKHFKKQVVSAFVEFVKDHFYRALMPIFYGFRFCAFYLFIAPYVGVLVLGLYLEHFCTVGVSV